MLRRPLVRSALLVGVLFVLGACAPTAAQAISFATTNIGVGNSPQSVAVGSFNSEVDSTLDLVVANEFSDDVSVLVGGAGGSFTVASTFRVGNHPTSVVVGQFNGDSDPDLAFTNYSANTVSVVTGGPGATFTGRTDIPVGSAPVSAAVGNLNGDSDPDLAVTNERTDDVSVLLGGTGATFATPTNFPVDTDPQTASDPQSVALGKLDGDSDLDLVVANKLTDNVSVLSGAGNGIFGLPTHLAAGSAAISVAVDKFNGDSYADLAVVNELSHNVSVLLGTGGGSFSRATNFPVGSLPDYVASGDLNGDSDPDLAVANQGSDNLSILLGGTGGGFTGPINFIAGDGPTSVAMGDFNADSYVDLAVTNEISNTVSILLATTPETTIDSGPSGPTNDSSPSFTFSSSDPGATFRCRVDGGALFSCTSPQTTSLADGAHTFEVRATDDSGRTDPTPATRAFTIDTVPPRIPTLTGINPGSPANDNTPRVKGTAEAGSTVQLYNAHTTAECIPANLIATEAAATFTSTGIQVAVPDNSTTTFRATATDPAGNVSGCSTSSITYSEVSPPPPAGDPGSGDPGDGLPLAGDPVSIFPIVVQPIAGAGAPDTSAPVMALAGKALTMDSRGVVSVSLSCPPAEPGGCQGSISLETLVQARAGKRAARRSRARKRKVKLGESYFRISGGTKATIKVRLSKRSQRLVSRLRKVPVVVVVNARDQAGNAQTTRKSLTLKAKDRR